MVQLAYLPAGTGSISADQTVLESVGNRLSAGVNS
jgi:hypothetical protein